MKMIYINIYNPKLVVEDVTALLFSKRIFIIIHEKAHSGLG